MSLHFDIVPAGDSALIVEFEERIDAAVNAQAVGLAGWLRAEQIPGVRDVVPTYRSVAVYFDPLRTDREALVVRIEREASTARPVEESHAEPTRIPVCYGGEFGPDIAHVAAFAGMSPHDVAAAHAGVDYRVFMLGFVPGFAYMGSVDPRIAAPRRATPRVLVSAGSVGIAARQTGVYPTDTPGGWQIIGRTPLKPFDVARADPFLMKPGEMIRFYAVSRGEFDRLQAEASTASR